MLWPLCLLFTQMRFKVLAAPNVVMNVNTWRRITLAALIVADKVFCLVCGFSIVSEEKKKI